MTWGTSEILIGALALMLGWAALSDIRARIISNRLNLAIALGAVLFWWATGLGWTDISIQVAVAAGVFILFAGAFAIGAMGGGDVKMAAALALWLPPGAVLALLVIMSIAGGVLTLAMLIRHRLARHDHALEVPYGVAIAFAGFWLISERFLYQFA
jgi:prepilin peptidase CpaA